MYIEFDSLDDILNFADLVCDSLDKTRLDAMPFLNDIERSRIWNAVYDFMNIYSSDFCSLKIKKD